MDFFYEHRSSLRIEKIDNICPIAIAKRILDIDDEINYDAEAFKSILTIPLTEEERKQYSRFIDNKDELIEFENFQKAVNHSLYLYFSVDEDSEGYFKEFVQNLFATIDMGLTNEQILLMIENNPVNQLYGGRHTNKRVEFICYNHEIEDSEFIYRSFKIADR